MAGESGQGVGFVILGIFGAIGFKRHINELVEARLRRQPDSNRRTSGTNFGADKVVGTAGAKVGEVFGLR